MLFSAIFAQIFTPCDSRSRISFAVRPREVEMEPQRTLAEPHKTERDFQRTSRFGRVLPLKRAVLKRRWDERLGSERGPESPQEGRGVSRPWNGEKWLV